MSEQKRCIFIQAEEDEVEKLEAAMNYYAKQDYRPVGPPAVIPSPEGARSKWSLLQLMVLRDYPRVPSGI